MSSTSSSLQWGRSVNAAETTKIVRSALLRGRTFNGAAALTLRKHDFIVAMAASFLALQWGRSVNAAETCS